MNQVAINPSQTAIQPGQEMSRIESVLIAGDLSKLTAKERETYYLKVCETQGINPLTRPFDYITLNGKLVLYANKGCAEQIRRVQKVSITIAAREMISDLCVVTANARDASGREDSSTGAVSVVGLKGEALANAMMKAETKAKRRVTLSICGLNMLDETEVESIPGTKLAQPPEGDGVQSEEYSPKYGRFAKKHLSKCDPVGLREEVEKYEAEAKEKGRDPLPWEQEFIEHATPLIEEFEKALAAPLESGAPRSSIKPIAVPKAAAKPKIAPEPAPVWDKDLPTITGVVVPPDYDPNAEYVFKGRHSLAGTKVKDVSRSELTRFLTETRAWFKKLGKEMTGDALLDATRVDDYLRTSAPDPDFFAGAPS